MTVSPWVAEVAKGVAREPALWPTAVRQVARLARRRWWSRAPRLPLPSDAYLSFRAVTAYGSADHPPEVHDVLTYLRWCRSLRNSRIGATTARLP